MDWRSAVEEHLATYRPMAESAGLWPERIILTRGAVATAARRAFVERLCAALPKAERVEALDRTHMQLGGLLPKGDAARREVGRRTLVVGTIGSPLRMSQEANICCPNYLHFSPTAFCTYRCAYCYLAGSCATVVAPVAKVFLNLEDVLAAIERRAGREDVGAWESESVGVLKSRARHSGRLSPSRSHSLTLSRPHVPPRPPSPVPRPAAFYLGKLQDALGLDPLTGFSRVLVPFFAGQARARLVMLSKSDAVGNLLGLDHRGHTAVSWSVNPEAVCREFEWGAPPLARRLDAARRCQEAGYPIRFLIMPMLPVEDWQRHYAELVQAIFASTRPERITLGGICSYGTALRLTAQALGSDNVIARRISRERSPDGRRRFPRELRTDLYRHVLAEIRRRDPVLPVGLCLEEPEIWHACGLDPAHPFCNCIW